ncbi:MAG: hypothetical protein ABI295_02390 [Xanthomarina sp.]
MFEKYLIPRRGLFSVSAGHGKIEEYFDIIGENDHLYITHIDELVTPMWDDLGRYETWVSYPTGIHKSRLIKWVWFQLELF